MENSKNNRNGNRDTNRAKTAYELMYEGTFITLEKDIPELLVMGNLDFVRKTVKRIERDSKFSNEKVWKAQFIVRKPDEEITRILETTENQGRHIMDRIKPDKTLYKVTKIGEGTKSTYRVEAVS